MNAQYQGLFTLWRRVKSFSQALGCRVIDFPDPESQKSFVYLPSLSSSLNHPPPISLPPPFDSYTWPAVLFFSVPRFRHSLPPHLQRLLGIRLPARLLSCFLVLGLSVSLASKPGYRSTEPLPASIRHPFPRWSVSFPSAVEAKVVVEAEPRLDSVLGADTVVWLKSGTDRKLQYSGSLTDKGDEPGSQEISTVSRGIED